MEGPRDIKSFIIPAPTGGLNYKEPLPSMAPDTAISMSNLIPNGSTVDVRGGLEKWAEVGSATTLMGLFTYACPNGKEYLIGYGEYYHLTGMRFCLYDLSTAAPYSFYEDYISYTISGARTPTAINFGGYLFIASGSVQTYAYRLGVPSGALDKFQRADVNITFTKPDAFEAATIGVYKNRIYMASGMGGYPRTFEQKIWYGNVEQVAGAIPASNFYDVSFLTQKGGQIVFASSVTRQEGELSQSLFAVVTENGEMLVFQGSYPGSTTWGIVGQYLIPKPLGKRAFFYVGSSLYIITQSGIFSFSELTSNYGSQNQLALSTDFINNKFPDYASYAINLDSLTSGLTNWYGAYSSRENKIFVGYPDSPSTYGMLVQDLSTRAWGQLNYRNQIAGTAVYDNKLIGFAPASYTYQLQTSGADKYFNGSTWTPSPISITAQLAPNYNDDFSTTKQFGDIKALVQCASPYSITAGLAVDFDLRSAGYNNYSRMPGGTYGLYQPRFSSGDRENLGKCCIINLGGQFNASDLPMKFVAFEVYYTDGGNW